MFRLNRLTDYAVVVMARMATDDKAGTATAAQISRDTGVPLPTVSKVLNALARYGLIVSQRGAGGGYALSQPAEEIGVADIIQAIEGPIALTACVDGSTGHCDVEGICPMRGSWDKVNAAIRAALRNVTLADMAAPFDPIASAPVGDQRRVPV